MAARKRPLRERRWRRLTRWLGGPDSWRRIVATGLTAGVTVAFVVALAVALVGRDGGSLDSDKPPVADPGVGGTVDEAPVETVAPPPVEEPTDAPIEEPPTDVPTEVIEEPPPTEVPPEPTPTIPDKPPPEPTLADGA